MATTITLHCPSVDKIKRDFTISPYSTHDKVLQGIRSVFAIDYAAVYNIRAQPIDNIRDCVSGKVVQVAAAKNEHVGYYKPWNCIMYNGEEGADVFWLVDGVGLPWEDLTDTQRCGNISSLAPGAKPGGFVLANTIRITRPYATVQQEVREIAAAAPEDMDSQYNHGMVIFWNWNWKWEFFLPASMKPDDLKDMSAKVPGLLVVLSSFTQSSARRVRAYVIEAVNARLSDLEDGEIEDPLLQEEDIVHVISTLYDKAGSLAAKIALAKENKVKEKARKEAWRMRLKSEGKGKGKARSDVDGLTDQLGGV